VPEHSGIFLISDFSYKKNPVFLIDFVLEAQQVHELGMQFSGARSIFCGSVSEFPAAPSALQHMAQRFLKINRNLNLICIFFFFHFRKILVIRKVL
jgi:hypothetical protein